MSNSDRKGTIENLMVTQRGLILLLTNREIKWSSGVFESYSDILTISDFQQAAKMLNNLRCDLLIIDAETLKDQTLSAVKEFKRNFPYRPVGILLEDTSDSTENLLSVGTDLILHPNLSSEEIEQQIRIVLNQNTARRAIVADIERLHVVSSLPILLRDLTNTEQIYLHAIKIIINLLNLEAVTIVIGNGDDYRGTTIMKPLVTTDQLIDGITPTDKNDPILWSIRHRMVQIYEDISLNPHFELSNGLSAHSPAVIVPFAYPGNQQGALAFFLPQGTPLLTPDTFIYEQFVGQLDSILLRAYQNELQARHLLLNRRLVEAWSTFAQSDDFEGVLYLLSSLIGDIKGIKDVLVSCENSHTKEKYLVDNHGGELIGELRKLNLQQILEEFQIALGESSEAAIINLQENNVQESEHLSRLFGSDQFAVIPVLASGERLGIILMAIETSYPLDALEMHLLENITNIAVNALQRITLRNIGLQNHNELTSILHSIREGIFYVDNRQRVTFCNPQFTELTSIAIADHLDQDVDGLLRALAMASNVPPQTYNQLQLARQQLTLADDELNYPIVTFQLWERNIDLSIEFVAINQAGDQLTWMGIAHSLEPANEYSLLEPSVERVRAAHTRLRRAINSISENQGQHSYNEYSELLENLRVDATLAGNRWDEFEDTYQLYLGGMIEHRKSAKLHNLLQRALADSRLNSETVALKVYFPAPTLIVAVDDMRFVQAFAHLLAYIVESLPSYTPVEIRVENQRETADIVITSTVLNPFRAAIEIMAQPADRMTEKQLGFDLLSALEIIRRSGVRITVEQSYNLAPYLRIAIPVVSPLSEEYSQESSQPVSRTEGANSALSRGPRSIVLIEGLSTISRRLKNLLGVEEFSLHRYSKGKDAILRLPSEHVDLIIVDQHLEGENALAVCREIRKQTMTPMMIIADKISNQERARFIQVGAEHFMTASTSTNELLDTIRSIVDPHAKVTSPDSLRVGDLYVDFTSRAVFLKNVVIELTRIEFDVLRTLILNRGQTVTHEQLLTEVWGPGYEAESQYLWVSISRLRKKLEADRDAPRYIRTQSGIGYYFAAP